MTIPTSDKPRQTASAPDFGEKRVRRYAARHFSVPPRAIHLQGLTPDASTRKYYRISTVQNPAESLIVSLYPTPFNPQDNSFLDVTRLFQLAGLPVPQVIDAAGTDGIILQEDLGDCSLTQWIDDARAAGDDDGVNEMYQRAIELIARIQKVSGLAEETGSVASRLAFDVDKLTWELNYFFDHFFGSLRRQEFEPGKAEAIKCDLEAVATELAERPRVLCHRDYHGMNLMVDPRGDLRMIDHQDARMGPAAYDLVPLLVERRLEPADMAWVESQQECFMRARAKEGLPALDREEFRCEFNLMTLQRQLKATGTFSYQTGVMGRGAYYEKYIAPAVATILRAMQAAGMKEYPALRAALEGD